MFNLNFMNRCLSEVKSGNLTTTEFTLLCLLNNDVQLNDGNTIQRHRSYFMKELNLSKSQVKRLMKSLTKKGFITEDVVGTSTNLKGNIIRLIYDIPSGVMDEPPVSMNEPIGGVMDEPPKRTCKKTYNNSRQISSQTSTGTCEKKSEEKMGTEPNKERTYSSKENNAYVDKCLRRFDTMLKYLYSIKDRRIYDEYTNEILKFRESIDLTRFTEKQRGLIEKKSEAWAKIAQGKEHFFNGQSEKNDNSCEDEFISIEPEQIDCDGAEPISMDEQSTADRLTYPQSSKNEKRPSPAKTDWSKVGEWVVDSTIRFSNYELWHKELMRILNKKFGNGWENAEYKVMSQASAIYNTCCKTALEYYNSKKGTELTASDGDMVELAPWEESINSNKNITPAEAVEHLKAKGAL